MCECTIWKKLKLKEVLKIASFILEDQEYIKLEKLLIHKNFKDARSFIDDILENNKNKKYHDSELLLLKDIENSIFNMMINN